MFILLPVSNNIFQDLLGGWCTIRIHSWCLKFCHFPRFVKQLITRGCSYADISLVSSSPTFSQTCKKILIPFWCFNTSHSWVLFFMEGVKQNLLISEKGTCSHCSWDPSTHVTPFHWTLSAQWLLQSWVQLDTKILKSQESSEEGYTDKS